MVSIVCPALLDYMMLSQNSNVSNFRYTETGPKMAEKVASDQIFSHIGLFMIDSCRDETHQAILLRITK